MLNLIKAKINKTVARKIKGLKKRKQQKKASENDAFEESEVIQKFKKITNSKNYCTVSGMLAQTLEKVIGGSPVQLQTSITSKCGWKR